MNEGYTINKQTLTINSNNFNWSYINGKKIKTIIITSNVTDPQITCNVPCSIQNSLETIIFKEGIEKIDFNFVQCSLLKKIVFPESLKVIGESAFRSCRALKEINFPHNLEEIGNYAFEDCKKLEELIFPGPLKVIGESAFEGCVSLKEIAFSENLEEIGRSAFWGCERLKELIFPQNLKRIGEQAFKSCESLQSIDIPKSVTDIFNEAFADCTRLHKIKGDLFFILHIDSLKNTLFFNKLKKDRDLVIYDGIILDGSACVGDVVIPEGIREIASGAFINNIKITSVTIPDKTVISHSAFKNCINLESVVLPSDLKFISSYLFENCLNLRNINIPHTVENVYPNPFTGTPWLEEMEKDGEPLVINGILVDGKGCKGKIKITGVKKILDNAFKGNLDITSVDINDDCISIGNRAFYECAFIETIKLPAQLKEIGCAAFVRCEHIKTVTIPDGVEIIPYNAFNSCYSLQHVDWPKSLKHIQNWAFDDNFRLKTDVPEDVKIDEKAFIIKKGKNHPIACVLEARPTQNKIQKNQYKKRNDIYVAIIPEGTRVIGENAFEGCRNLRKVVLPQSLEVIEESAFKSCDSLEKITFPSSLKSIGYEAFYNTNLTSVDIPASVDTLGSSIFNGCENLICAKTHKKTERSIFSHYYILAIYENDICTYDKFKHENEKTLQTYEDDTISSFEENTPPIYWHLFSLIYLLAAGAGIWAYFSNVEALRLPMVITCAALIPAGPVVKEVCLNLGFWEKKKREKSSRLSIILYSPAILLPIGIIGFSLYKILSLGIPSCFLISTSAIVVIAVFIDICLNLYKERFVLFIQSIYEDIAYFVNKRIWSPFKKYILNPLTDLLSRLFEWLYDNVLEPIGKIIKKIFLKLKPIWNIIKDLVCNIIRWLWEHIIHPFLVLFGEYILSPLLDVLRFIFVDIIFNYFLRYILIIFGSLLAVSGGFIKGLFGWISFDGNGIVHYFITIPLLILAVIGAIIYFFIG